MLYKRDFTANMSIDDIEMEKSKNFNNDDLLGKFFFMSAILFHSKRRNFQQLLHFVFSTISV